jgi:hypothetical protein
LFAEKYFTGGGRLPCGQLPVAAQAQRSRYLTTLLGNIFHCDRPVILTRILTYFGLFGLIF